MTPGWRLTLFALAALLVASTAVRRVSAGQDAPRSIPQDALESITRLDCTFATGVSAEWRGGRPDVTPLQGSPLLSLVVEDIDGNGGTATMRVGGRTASVSVRSDRSNLFILETESNETLLLTTVFSQESGGGRLKAVHTRTGRNPAQLYGDCQVAR